THPLLPAPGRRRMTGPDRQESLERARHGDEEARGALLEGYRPYLRALMQGLGAGSLRARLDESDLVQSALLEAHRQFAGFPGAPPAGRGAWRRQFPGGVARHALRDPPGAARRAVGREGPLEAEPADPSPTPGEEAARAELAARLAAGLARL